jgi:xylitol oxidase
VLPQIESALEPFNARPHWGKLFAMPADNVEALYPRLPDFLRLVERFDGDGKFRNAFMSRFVNRGAAAS